MDANLPEYELYAIRYAERDARRRDHFIGGDPHDGPMPMDYFVWAAIGPRAQLCDRHRLYRRGRRRPRQAASALPGRVIGDGRRSTATRSPT